MFDRRFVVAVAGGALFPPVFAAALLTLLQPYSGLSTPLAPTQLVYIKTTEVKSEDALAPLEKSDISFAAHAWSPGVERSADEDLVLKEKAEIAMPIAKTTEAPESEASLGHESAELLPAQQEPVSAKNTAPRLIEEPEESRELVAKEPQDGPPAQAVELNGLAGPKTEQRATETFVVTANQQAATQSRAVEEETAVEQSVASSAAPTGTSDRTSKMKAVSAGVSSKSRRQVRKVIARPIAKPPMQGTRKIATRKKAPEKVASARPAKKLKAIPILAKGGVEQNTWNSHQWPNWDSYHPYQF